MTLPPDEIPKGLSVREYRRLSLQYFLMGQDDKAGDAFALGCSALDPDESSNDAEIDMKPGIELPAASALRLTDVVTRLMREYGETGPSSEDDKPLEEVLEQLKENLSVMGVPDDKVDFYISELIESIKTAVSFDDPPPRVVPTDLSAREFYQLGVEYKRLGWTEQARDALTYSMESDEKGEWGTRARQYLLARLPRHPVPLMAEQTNIEGFNKLAVGDIEGARLIFIELIENYPDFEWPYGNLGSLHLRQGRLREADEILREGVRINPNYVNGWLHLARLKALEDDMGVARDCLQKARDILPNDKDIESIARCIDELSELSQDPD